MKIGITGISFLLLMTELLDIGTLWTLEGRFCTLYLQGPFFCTVFARPKKQKRHSQISEEKMTKISDYVFFSFGSLFLQKRKNLLIFLHFQILYVFNTQNPTSQEFYWKSVSYNRNPGVTRFFEVFR